MWVQECQIYVNTNTEVQRQNGRVVVGGGHCGLLMMLFGLNHQVILHVTWCGLQLRDFISRVLAIVVFRLCEPQSQGSTAILQTQLPCWPQDTRACNCFLSDSRRLKDLHRGFSGGQSALVLSARFPTSALQCWSAGAGSPGCS